MSISDKTIDELITIYKEEFEEEIDRTQATEMAHRLLTLYRVLVKKLPAENVSPSLTQHDEVKDHSRIGFQA